MAQEKTERQNRNGKEITEKRKLLKREGEQ